MSGGARRRVWITRASPGAEETARRVAALGYGPIIAPQQRQSPIAGPPVDLSGVGALAFTSANGVAAFAARSPERGLPTFAVGAATARAALGAGFVQVISAEGDVAALAQAIAAHGRMVGEVLHAAPTEPAGDLTGDLAARGIAARRVALYETVTQMPDPGATFLIRGAEGVLVHSPKAARALGHFLAGHPEPGLVAVCLSAAVAEPLTGLAQITVADAPTEAAVLEALAQRLPVG